MSSARNLTAKEVLDLLPQQEPFRFIDEILEIDEDHIVASYTWRADADFYRGHFPGNPITPGVLLVESMAQTGVVALGLYTLASQGGIDDAKKLESEGKVIAQEFVDPETGEIIVDNGEEIDEGELRKATRTANTPLAKIAVADAGADELQEPPPELSQLEFD